MRILTVVYSLGKGGTERAAVNFAIAYLQEKHDSRILFTESSGIREDECKSNSVKVYDYSQHMDLFGIQAWNPEIIHLHSHGLSESQVNRIHAMNSRAIFIETNVFSRPSPWETILTKSFQLSSWCLWLYLQRGGNKNKAFVVPNPVQCQNFYPVSKQEQSIFREMHNISLHSLLLGRIGQAFNGKWSLLTIKAFERVKTYLVNVQLLLVNPPQFIISHANASPYANSIVIIDKIIGDANLRTAYSSIDLLLHTADQGESFGMALAESLLCETPVITLATPWGDNSQIEVVANRICGFAVDSPKNYHKAVKQLVLDNSARDELGRKGRMHILTNYESRIVASLAIQSIWIACNSTSFTPSSLYNIENSPTLLTMLLLNNYNYREYLRIACDPAPLGAVLLLYLILTKVLPGYARSLATLISKFSFATESP